MLRGFKVMSRRAITKVQAVIIVIIIIIAAIGGVAAYYMTRPKPKKTLIVGVMGPFTGPAAKSGMNIRDGALMAIDDAKEMGLFPMTLDGVVYDDVEVVLIDSQSDPEKAVVAYEDAIVRRGVQIIVTGWHSSVAMAIHEISTKYGIIHVGHMGETQFLCYKREENPDASKYYFKGWPCPPIFAGLYAEPLTYLIDKGVWHPKTHKYAIIVEDTDFGRGWGDAIKESLDGMGWEMAYYDVVALLPSPEVEFYPFLEKYMAAGVSVIAFTHTASASFAAIMKQWRELEVPAMLICHGVGWFPEWYELAGEASDYIVCMDAPAKYKPEHDEWISKFKAKYGYEPSLAAAGHSYDYMMIALKALKEAGTLDPDKIRSVIVDRAWEGVWHTYYWPSGKYDPVKQPWAHFQEPRVGEEYFFFPFRQAIGGEMYVIWPEKYATGTFKEAPWW